MKTSSEVDDALRTNAENALATLTDPAPYAPDADIEDNSHMEAGLDELLDDGLINELRRGGSLHLATEDELRNKPLKCHAVLIGDDSDQTIFIKKRSPVQLARKSFVATLMNDSLNKVESPIFAFDNRYDSIITSDKVYVLDKNAFEGLFKDSPAVLAKTGEWIGVVAAAIPMDEGSVDVLDGVLRRNQFLRKKFLAVSNREHLGTITPARLRAEIKRHGYDPADLMQGNKLAITDVNVKVVLQVLNEDLFTGGFSQARYAAGSKRTLP